MGDPLPVTQKTTRDPGSVRGVSLFGLESLFSLRFLLRIARLCVLGSRRHGWGTEMVTELLLSTETLTTAIPRYLLRPDNSLDALPAGVWLVSDGKTE